MVDTSSLPQKLVWSAGQVAYALGIGEQTFLAKRTLLETEHGFPRKVPGFNKWSIAAVTDWINTNGGTYQPSTPSLIPNDDPEIDAIVADLEAHYGRAAA
jgi:hypothetical protein